MRSLIKLGSVPRIGLRLTFIALFALWMNDSALADCPALSLPENPTLLQRVDFLEAVAEWAIALRDRAPMLSPAEEQWLAGELAASDDRRTRAMVSKEFAYKQLRDKASRLIQSAMAPVQIMNLEMGKDPEFPKREVLALTRLEVIGWWDLMRLIQSTRLAGANSLFELVSPPRESKAPHEYDDYSARLEFANSCEALAWQIGDKIIVPHLKEGMSTQSETNKSTARDD